MNFATKDGNEPPKDCEMNPTEFAVAFVRLANLWSLMTDGMEGASKLAHQTSQLMNKLSSTR